MSLKHHFIRSGDKDIVKTYQRPRISETIQAFYDIGDVSSEDIECVPDLDDNGMLMSNVIRLLPNFLLFFLKTYVRWI